jgi:hypothetical protein
LKEGATVEKGGIGGTAVVILKGFPHNIGPPS